MQTDPRYCMQPLGSSMAAWIDEGEASVNRYPVASGNYVFLFDKNEKRFFIKSVDISGMPQPLREFKYEEVIRQKETVSTPVSTDYVTKQQMEDLETSIITKVDDMLQKYLSNKKNIKDKGD